MTDRPWAAARGPPPHSAHEEAGSLEHHENTSQAGLFLQRVQQSWALAWASLEPYRSSTASRPLHLVLGVVGQGPAAARQAAGSSLSNTTVAHWRLTGTGLRSLSPPRNPGQRGQAPMLAWHRARRAGAPVEVGLAGGGAVMPGGGTAPRKPEVQWVWGPWCFTVAAGRRGDRGNTPPGRCSCRQRQQSGCIIRTWKARPPYRLS